MKGQIVKIISNLYTVSSNNKIYECHSRGKFRKDNITPVVGDYVIFDEKENYILEIQKRKNSLVRPFVANIDQAFIITSVKIPMFSTNLLDKLKPLGQTGTNELYYSLDYIIANNIFAASETDSQGNKMFLNPITNDKLYGCIKVTYDVNKFEVKTEFIDKNNQAEMDNCKG